MLSSFWGLSGVFCLTAGLTAIGLVITFTYLPAPSSPVRSNSSNVIQSLQEVLAHGQLMRLNLGVFVLHGALTALFIVLPLRLIDQANLPVASHWQVYLPVMVVAFALMVPPMILAEKRGRMKLVFLTAVGMIAAAKMAFFAGPTTGAVSLIATVFLFFLAFNLLEATMPSMMSKLSPPHAKGAASGVYATFQFAGAFSGGLAGGWLYQTYGAESVYLACVGAIAVWLLAALSMRVPQANQSVQVAISQAQFEQMKSALLALDGVYEINYSPDLAAVDLRVDRHTFQISQLQALGLQPGA
jgi:predicted MFS family arabinose efflux permease